MSADTAIALEEPLQTVASDLPCIGCGYNLRTLAETAVCPECARPVSDSIRFQRLHLADADWLRRLRTGTVLMAVAASLMAVTICALLSQSLSSGRAHQIAILVLCTLMSVAWSCGIWLGTTAEPGTSGKERRSLWRWLNRILAINSLVLAAVLAGLTVLSMMTPRWTGLPNWAGIPLYCDMYALMFLCPMLACLYFRAIDRRAHRPALQRTNTIIAVLMAIDLAVVATTVIAQLAFRVYLSPGPVLLAMLFCYVAAFVLGVFGFIGHWRLFTQAIGTRTGRNP